MYNLNDVHDAAIHYGIMAATPAVLALSFVTVLDWGIRLTIGGLFVILGLLRIRTQRRRDRAELASGKQVK
jgi:hypothetical protein